jgi:hypothetical protein
VNLPRLGIYLLELELMCHNDLPSGVEYQEPGTGRSLVDGAYEGMWAVVSVHCVRVGRGRGRVRVRVGSAGGIGRAGLEGIRAVGGGGGVI